MSVELILGDCLTELSKLQNKSIDLIICDLPYGVTQNKSDIQIPLDKLWVEYERIIKDNGAILLFGQGIFYVDLVVSNRKLYKYDIVWDKVLTSNFLNAKFMPLRKHEQIAVFYKNKPTYNPQFTKGKPIHGKGNSYKHKDVKNENYGDFKPDDSRKGCTDKYPTSIVTVQKTHPSKARHRTEKPVALLEYLIKTYSNENDTVLDNCMGSGNCGIAAIKNNRNFIGMEIDEKIFNDAKDYILTYSN